MSVSAARVLVLNESFSDSKIRTVFGRQEYVLSIVVERHKNELHIPRTVAIIYRDVGGRGSC